MPSPLNKGILSSFQVSLGHKVIKAFSIFKPGLCKVIFKGSWALTFLSAHYTKLLEYTEFSSWQMSIVDSTFTVFIRDLEDVFRMALNYSVL